MQSLDAWMIPLYSSRVIYPCFCLLYISFLCLSFVRSILVIHAWFLSFLPNSLQVRMNCSCKDELVFANERNIWTEKEIPSSWCPVGTSLFCQYAWGGAPILISTSKLNTEQVFSTSAFLWGVLLLFHTYLRIYLSSFPCRYSELTKTIRSPHKCFWSTEIKAGSRVHTNITETSFLDYDIWTVYWNVLFSFIWQVIIIIYIHHLQNILWSRTTSMEFSVLDSPFFQPVPAKIGIPLSWQVAPLFPCQFLTAGESLVLEKSLTIINYTAALPQALHRRWEWTSWIH